MRTTTAVRPGGRSARVQQAVHDAVRQLADEVERDQLTIPLIAERAGVTPSTVYRRWGSLKELMAHVAAERLKPEAEPQDTGSLAGDLLAWAGEFMEDMVSLPGQQVLADALGSTDAALKGRCRQWQCDQVSLFLARAHARGEIVSCDIDTLLDLIMGPLTYRLSYAPDTVSESWLRRCIARALGSM
ncbi:TetR/AcrR family transcriptional regulator [Larsenimonas rhizosphaerae]|uniref:TetR/AcrR family transcriptional regulator n=1 Tax=Larsenimonas rhizosphaerae TaxID=2944682 RepID=A0AA41ZGA9_9GAMM|nr:TetR/AcrR family transcriptional regulator [Larsenimonas rhizosphaerae]MCM2131932.1 TetR/AcrR family transcriptional regulator [Larsenimonas rhizosphaerae]MCX2524762.1 TetR/AcrR family transcriptional regulator [Larsenimonas rhizosphaerae]